LNAFMLSCSSGNTTASGFKFSGAIGASS
jgi:hypothetical protein